MKEEKCLFVDLDGTLIKSDLLFECLVPIIKNYFYALFLAPFWLLKGKAYLKDKFSDLVSINPEILPYNNNVLEYIRKEKENGSKIILATASNIKLAKSISDYLGIFDDVIASSKEENLKGKNKLNKIKLYIENNNTNKEFSYIGDSEADVKIFNETNIPIVVGNKNVFNKIKSKNDKTTFVDGENDFSLKKFFKMIRTYQWVKNFLIFLPLILAHKFLDVNLLLKALVAFFSFSFLASSVYIINDIMDVESDRIHPSKKNRPIASGAVKISSALKVAFILMPLSFIISIFLGKEFLFVLLTYFITTSCYSFYLKKIMLVDILILSLLYTVRMFAGGVALNIYLSPWLFMFSMFFFFSLACAKRYSELYAVRNNLQDEIKGRGYQAQDLEQIQIFGSSSGYIAILIFALYIQSDISMKLYKTPSFFWALCPIMLYWISRVWLLSHRGQMTQDPIIFALKDKVSYVVLILSIIIFGVAKYV
ncbi:MAG: UbiA family prenyltransferase [Bdellovibrionota bacterium]|nr:UbiA family prenyltransferase [Pseudomonadota bacterium]MDY6090792.1 UbiA family prenyltransferase [Bdellovibrionota bacterium]